MPDILETRCRAFFCFGRNGNIGFLEQFFPWYLQTYTDSIIFMISGRPNKTMSTKWIQFFRETLRLEPFIHPLDHRMAQKYVKQRLVVIYPELKNDPIALDKAYNILNLEPRRGIGKDEAPTVFDLRLPE